MRRRSHPARPAPAEGGRAGDRRGGRAAATRHTAAHRNAAERRRRKQLPRSTAQAAHAAGRWGGSSLFFPNRKQDTQASIAQSQFAYRRQSFGEPAATFHMLRAFAGVVRHPNAFAGVRWRAVVIGVWRYTAWWPLPRCRRLAPSPPPHPRSMLAAGALNRCALVRRRAGRINARALHCRAACTDGRAHGAGAECTIAPQGSFDSCCRSAAVQPLLPIAQPTPHAPQGTAQAWRGGGGRGGPAGGARRGACAARSGAGAQRRAARSGAASADRGPSPRPGRRVPTPSPRVSGPRFGVGGGWRRLVPDAWWRLHAIRRSLSVARCLSAQFAVIQRKTL